MQTPAPNPQGQLRPLDRLYEWPGVLLTLTAIFWAGNALASRLAVGHISPFLLVFLRWGLVLAFLWPLYGAQVRAHWSEVRPMLGKIAVLSLLGFTGFNALFYYAGHHTTALNLGILQASIPVVVLLGAFLMHGVRPTLLQIAGVLITSMGVVVVATGGAPLSILESGLNRGDLAMLVACVLNAMYIVALGDRPAMSGPAFLTLLALMAALTSVPLVLVEAATGRWLVMLYVAIFPSCLAQLFFLRGVDLIGPGRAGVFVNLVPVFAAILAVMLLNEPFGLYHGVALVLVIGGISLAQRQKRA